MGQMNDLWTALEAVGLDPKTIGEQMPLCPGCGTRLGLIGVNDDGTRLRVCCVGYGTDSCGTVQFNCRRPAAYWIETPTELMPGTVDG